MARVSNPATLNSIKTVFGGAGTFRQYLRGAGLVPNTTPYNGIAASGNLLMSSFNGIVYPIPSAWDIFSSSSPGDTAQSSITFNTDGTISYSTLNSDEGSNPGGSNWWSPTTGGIGNSYWLRVTEDLGTFTTHPGLNTWLALSSARTFTKSGTSGDGSVHFTFSIAADSSGTDILYSVSGNDLHYTHI